MSFSIFNGSFLVCMMNFSYIDLTIRVNYNAFDVRHVLFPIAIVIAAIRLVQLTSTPALTMKPCPIIDVGGSHHLNLKKRCVYLEQFMMSAGYKIVLELGIFLELGHLCQRLTYEIRMVYFVFAVRYGYIRSGGIIRCCGWPSTSRSITILFRSRWRSHRVGI